MFLDLLLLLFLPPRIKRKAKLFLNFLAYHLRKSYNILMDGDLDLSKNIEIEKALKEFEEKSQTEQIQKNPEVLKNSETPRMIELVIKYSGGSVKNERQAQYVLLGLVIIMISISLYLFFSGSKSKDADTRPILMNPEGIVGAPSELP